MDVSPAIAEVGDQISQEEGTDKDEDVDLCRICRSPEEPHNPLRYPCLCRGSIKYVHEDCLRLWLNRRGTKKCEVCGRSYSFVPLYAEDAPERLPCNEFLIGLLLGVTRFLNLLAPWVQAFLLNTYFFSLHPWGQAIADDFQRELEISRTFASLSAGLVYNAIFVLFMTASSIIRVEVEDHRLRGGVPAENFVGNGQRQGIVCGVVQVLWACMKLLFDWYYLKVVHSIGQPPDLVFVPQNALHEFGVIRKLFFLLDDNAFALLAICVYVPSIVILLPSLIGIVLATVAGSLLAGLSPVFLGYTVIVSISFVYFLFTVCPVSLPTVVRWFLLGFLCITLILPYLLWKFSVEACKNLWWFPVGFHFITVKLPCLLWKFLVEACKNLWWFPLGFCHLWNFLVIVCKNLFVIKDAFIFCLKIGVLPWMIGWWLEICTSPLFGTTISQKFEIPSGFLLVSSRWMSGIICLLEAYSNMNLIQQIIHKRAFWFLQDVTDPDYKITKLNLGYTLFAFASHGVLLVILFHLPLKAITLISPSFLPLKFWITDGKPSSFTHAIYFRLMIACPNWLIEQTKPAIKFIVHNWIITVSSWLQLSDFLLVVPRGEAFHLADQNGRPAMQPRRRLGNHRWFQLCSIAEGSMVIMNESQNAEDDMEDKRDNRFLPRIALMLVLAALSLSLFSTAFMALPILLGRVSFDLISSIVLRSGVEHDDFCTFWIGCYVLQEIYIITCYVSDHIQKGRIDLLVRYALIWIRSGFFFSIWIFVIPGLLGFLIDLMIIIPLRVPLNESPVFFLIQDWLIGLVVLHIWTFLTMFTHINWFATEAWRGKLERIKNVGIDQIPSMWLFQDVLVSIIDTLVTTLCIPYLLVKCLFPLLGLSQSIGSVVERLIWPVLLALITAWFTLKLTRNFINYLHQLVFNERYLVGERVDNLIEDNEQETVNGA